MATALFEQSATNLARLLEAREVSSEEVTRAHLDRIEAVDPGVRAFTEVLREQAIAAARKADDERRGGQRRGTVRRLSFRIDENRSPLSSSTGNRPRSSGQPKPALLRRFTSED